MNTHRLRAFCYLALLIAATCITLGLPVRAQGGTGTIERVSLSSAAAEANGDSEVPAISTDGRYVAFASDATNLVSGDTNDAEDIFVRDRQTGQTTRVSVSSSGVQGNNDSDAPAISYDGRYVAFQSMASNLAAADTNSTWDVFVHDRQTGQTTCVSVSPSGEVGTNYTFKPMLSGDGRYVVFYSYAGNLVAGDANGKSDVFVRDMQLGQTFLVSVSSAGVQADQGASTADISDDGRYVAFNSWSTNLVPGDVNNKGDVFVHDRQTGETTMVSVGSGDVSDFPSISGDGRYVAFWSAARLAPEDSNSWSDIYVRDRQTGETTAVSVNTSGVTGNGSSYQPDITADGRYVAFESVANDLVAGDSGSGYDVFVRDRQTAQTRRVSVNEAGQPASGVQAAITNDDRYVAFSSNASNLVADDTNYVYDVFVHDRDGVAGAPTVTGFSPTSGPVGTSVTINGTNFTGATSVKFNGVSQPAFTVVSATQITAAVPAGATTGKISVTTPGGTAQSATNFTVVAAPTITSFSPTSGPIGASVTINGTAFTGATSVKFNGVSQPTFTVVSATQITAAVPAGATTGPIAVTTPGGTATSASDFTVTVVPATAIYLSATGNGTIGGKAFTSADILSYVQATNTWDVLYDGSAINTPKNLGAFAFVGNEMLLGFSVAQVVPGLGTAKVPAQDLLRFTPTSTGYNNTAGTFALYFDGSDVGLTTSAEAIDALWIDAQGRLYISTTGTAKVNGPTGAAITAHDEDVLRFTPTSTGANTAGAWALYWDPTSVTGMSAEDINGYWEDPATGARYVTILGGFNIGNTAYGGKFAGNGKTILRFAPNAAAPGGWAPAEKVTWLAAGATFPSNIDGIEMGR